ncbi:hypothetical protein JKP88DRAFT_244348 [Tribonema minus]|uniref:Uncharacterized protein n=1 Tax=Tribonema minus TaxID=303371 RepID=A0A835Z923_9STRA|nr:hypothetical protein JKP88DRAFT_244348 [Tribonema minus]
MLVHTHARCLKTAAADLCAQSRSVYHTLVVMSVCCALIRKRRLRCCLAPAEKLALIMVASARVHGMKAVSHQRRFVLVAITATLLASVSSTASALPSPHHDEQQALRSAIHALQASAADRKLVDCVAQADATCGPGTACATCVVAFTDAADAFKKAVKELAQGDPVGSDPVTTCIDNEAAAAAELKAAQTGVTCVAVPEPCTAVAANAPCCITSNFTGDRAACDDALASGCSR